MMNEKNKPMVVMMAEAETKITKVVNEVVCETGLPAFLLEGIFAGILNGVMRQKNAELSMGVTSMQQEQNGKEETREGELNGGSK